LRGAVLRSGAIVFDLTGHHVGNQSIVSVCISMRLITSLLLSLVAAQLNAQVAYVDTYAENDVRVFSGIDLRDRHYTQGLHIRVGYVEGKLPRLLTAAVAVLPARIRRLCGSGECNGGCEFGQSIYTPQNIRRPLFPPYDRPYGAWLYGGALLQARELGHVLHTFSADAGVVGPQAYGKEIQTWWHRDVVHVPTPLGWEHQLRNEPALQIRYSQQRRLAEINPSQQDRYADLTVHAGGALGNVFTLLSAGPTFRAGYNISDELGERQLSNVAMASMSGPSPAASSPPRRVVLYAFISGDGRAVARNIFLDGNCCVASPSAHVNKRRFVGDVEGGVVAGYSAWRLTWRQVRRSREFVGQHRADVFGSVEVTYTARR
jgi:hypothetical protein